MEYHIRQDGIPAAGEEGWEDGLEGDAEGLRRPLYDGRVHSQLFFEGPLGRIVKEQKDWKRVKGGTHCWVIVGAPRSGLP